MKKCIFFPNEVSQYDLKLSPDFKMMWNEIQIPNEVDLERAMKTNGLQLARTQKRKPTGPQKKQRQARKVKKLVNGHLDPALMQK